MAGEFRYPLTRICLRTGQLTLPQKLLELFPEHGAVTAIDSELDKEFELVVSGPRTVAGFAGFFEAHRLEVNDELLIRPLDDGRYAVTALARPKKLDYADPTTVEELLDTIYQMVTPMTEAEIRALNPDLPDEFDLSGALVADRRFIIHEGRWQPVEKVARLAEHEGREDGEEVEGPRRVTVTPYPRRVLFPGESALNSEMESGDRTFQNRARESLLRFGFQVQGLPHGQLLARADLGRKHYSVLVHVLSEEKIDWAALLSRRRETAATYLAVFGDYRDLHRLSAPAELARATLWSWDAISRAEELTQTVVITCFDLEPHFENDGLYEQGLERFERTIEQRVAERGIFSAVLTRLAGIRSSTIFVLEDVVLDNDIPRDQVVHVLEQLAQPPFHMVVKVDSGEFCLRSNVPDALLTLSEYALSLREQLPLRNRPRVKALPEPEADSDTSEAIDADTSR
ncbi:MAG: hypothetical protein JSV66_18500 [Trueperaceae bacterium]|nr:MAG: hypothetical protein JSV66_18500 [Trueperaceae bacterium]